MMEFVLGYVVEDLYCRILDRTISDRKSLLAHRRKTKSSSRNYIFYDMFS